MIKQASSEDVSISNATMHIRDVSSREIFKNNVLTCQFLKDYTGLSIFADVQPEDIEDETTKFKMHLGIEVEGDSVKKIHIRTRDHSEEVYVISLIEHKSRPDPDTIMQILIYMSVIWRDYAKDRNGEKKNASKAVDFRYPLIIPIIYYEGAGEWTSSMRLSDRISHAELARDYIPDFTCNFVPLKDYDNSELIGFQNEMSLIMLINKIQRPEDFHEFRENTLDYLKSIYSGTSADI